MISISPPKERAANVPNTAMLSRVYHGPVSVEASRVCACLVPWGEEGKGRGIGRMPGLQRSSQLEANGRV